MGVCLERASITVETLFCVPILLLIAGGSIDYGMVLRENAVVVSAARAGARAAAATRLGEMQDYSVNYGNPPNVFLCVVAKQTARKFLRDGRLNPDNFDVEVAPQDIDVEIAGDGVGPAAGVRVTVRHRAPRWFLFWRNATQASASSVFVTESASAPGAC